MSEAAARLPRVDRWLGNRGAGVRPPSWAGARLLDHRLSIRRRCDLVLGVAGAGVLILFFVPLSRLDYVGYVPTTGYALVEQVAAVLGAVVVLLRTVVVARGDRQTLETGWASSSHVVRRWPVGLLRSVGIAAVVVVAVAAVVVVGARDAGTVRWVTIVGWLVTVALVAASFTVVFRRPVSSPDAQSIGADERLRSNSYAMAAMPLLLLALVTGAMLPYHDVVGQRLVFLPVVLAILALTMVTGEPARQQR